MASPFADYILIPLTQGQFAKISYNRLDDIVPHRWFANYCIDTRSFYAVRGHKLPSGKWTNVKMHRQILGLVHGDKKQGDHINHDTLDNRDENLRIATRQQQVWHRRKQRSNTTGFNGVSYFGAKSYRVQVQRKFIGLFPQTPEGLIEAAKAYDDAATRYFGEFAHLNFPHEV